MRIRVFAGLAACAALGACASGQGGLGALGGASLSPDSGRYLASAAANDRFEVQAAQLAAARAQRPDVRALAQEFAEAHGRSAQQFAAAALQAGMPEPAPSLTAGQQRMLGELEQAAAGAIDALYLGQQYSAQAGAMRLHRAYALSGDAEPLRWVAAAASAAASGHFQEVRRIRRAVQLDS